METLISSRLFGHFAETFREGKTITENKVTDAYGEFISQLSLLANGEQAVIDKLRHLRILELELDLYRDIPGHRPEHIMEIYLTKTTSLVKMEIELLLFSVEHPECQVSSDMQKKAFRRPIHTLERFHHQPYGADSLTGLLRSYHQ